MKQNDYWFLYRAALKNTSLTSDEIQSIKTLYSEEGRATVYEHVKKKKIVPAASCLFCKLDIDTEYWHPIAQSYRERNERIIECLDLIYSALAKAGVTRIAVVENFGALLYSGNDLAMFGSGDVDNYADISEIELIYGVFRSLGFSISENKSGNILISSAFRNDDFFPDHFYFGINWDVTTRVKLPCLTSKSDFISWDDCLYYKDTGIRIPQAETLMYICLMHVAVHGFCKTPDIRLYYDIANVAVKSLDWSKIKEWAVHDANCLRIAVACTLAHRLVDVDIPNDIMMLGKNRRRERLINFVSKPKENVLKDFPGKVTSIGIDLMSCDGGILSGLEYVLWPSSEWIKRKYGTLASGRIKHIIGLL